MALDFFDLRSMKKNHPAWKLMTAEYGPLIGAFLDRSFREHHVQSIPESQLVLLLEDFLFHLSETEGPDSFPREAKAYLDDWAEDDKGWLRKYYSPGTDEPLYDLTPAAERALQWMEGLFESTFVGTESRLYTVIELLKQIVQGVENDAQTRINQLKAERKHLDEQIRRIQAGDIPLLDERGIKERFYQFSRTARELLSDFRAVEHNFRSLDRQVREQVAGWTGEKGQLLQSIFGHHDAILESDQGKSFQAFWDFLMSPSRQEELTELLDRVFELPTLAEEVDDRRLRRVHFDWMRAGEQTQRTVARLSQQLRRFLDDQAYFENKRIMQLIDSIEQGALEVRDSIPPGDFMQIDELSPSLTLPFARPLFVPSQPPSIDSLIALDDEVDVDPEALFNTLVVDKKALWDRLHRILEDRTQVALDEVVELYPLEHGLAELVTYLTMATETTHSLIDEQTSIPLEWLDTQGNRRRATLPQVIFLKGGRP